MTSARTLLATAVVALAAAGARAAGGAAVEGVVALPPQPIAAPVIRYATPTVRPIRDPDPPAAIVYLDGTGAEVPAGTATVFQDGYQFRPGLTVVTPGTTVLFPNHDEEYHSVFSYSKARRFDLGRYQKDESPPPLVFEQPGLVKLFCDIHDHMRGTILVLDTPYFQKTDAAGRYRLDGLPPGRFVLKAWIDESTVREQPVDLRAGETLRVDFPAE